MFLRDAGERWRDNGRRKGFSARSKSTAWGDMGRVGVIWPGSRGWPSVNRHSTIRGVRRFWIWRRIETAFLVFGHAYRTSSGGK
jgi:hypothetical protein